MLLLALGMTATIASLTSSLPQLLRLARTRLTAGVSADAQLLLLGCLLAWTVYAAAMPDLWLGLASAIPLVTVGGTCILLVREGALAAARLAVATALMLALSVLLLFLHVEVLALAATLWGLAGLAPQARLSARLRRCPGLSSVTWTLNLVRAGLWLSYGVLTGQLVLWVGSAAQLPFIALILASALAGRCSPGNSDRAVRHMAGNTSAGSAAAARV